MNSTRYIHTFLVLLTLSVVLPLRPPAPLLGGIGEWESMCWRTKVIVTTPSLVRILHIKS